MFTGYDFRRPAYKVSGRLEKDQGLIGVEIRGETRHGILTCNHEISISFKKEKDGNLKFLTAWEISSEEIFYKANELSEFERDHPGLLSDIELAIKEGRVIMTEGGAE